MKNVIVTSIFCASFFSIVFTAESPQSPFITRNKGLGNTGTSTEVSPTSKLIGKFKVSAFSEEFLKHENLHVSPRDHKKPGSQEQLKPGYYRATKAPELSNPPVKQ